MTNSGTSTSIFISLCLCVFLSVSLSLWLFLSFSFSLSLSLSLSFSRCFLQRSPMCIYIYIASKPTKNCESLKGFHCSLAKLQSFAWSKVSWQSGGCVLLASAMWMHKIHATAGMADPWDTASTNWCQTHLVHPLYAHHFSWAHLQ